MLRNGSGYDDVHCFVRCEKVQESKLAEWCEAHMQAERPILHCRQHELDRLANGKYDRKGMMRALKESSWVPVWMQVENAAVKTFL